MEKEKFEYTYSAPSKLEREEIEDIRRDYIEKTDTQIKFDRLKSLDKKVKLIPKLLAWSLGIVGILVFGLGLTMVLEWKLNVWGIIVGVMGTAMMVANYFIYKKIKTHVTKKHKNEILLLSDELLDSGK